MSTSGTQSCNRHTARSAGRQAGLALAVVLASVLGLSITAASAQELTRYAKKAGYDDVRFDLTNAITNKGLVINSNGKVADMLTRTGKDVGSTRQVYKAAEYFAFCSAQLSRQMMEADAESLGYCPFIMYIYESAAKPGEVVVGYRKLPAAGAAAKAFAGINSLLDGIAKEATK